MEYNNEQANYSSCLLQGSYSSSSSIPCFMTASSPVPFCEISGELSIPHISQEIEQSKSGPLAVSLHRNKSSRSQIKETSGKFKCRRCGKRLKTKGGLNLHLREHQPELFLIRCPDCPFFTYQRANFSKHAAVKHRKDVNGVTITEDLQCPHTTICTFKCFTDEQLNLHLARKHTRTEDKPYKCLKCEYSSVEKAALGKHVAIVHNKKRDYDCDICGFRSQTSSGIARHKRSHLEAKPHPCHVCTMSYADKKRLKDHLLKHSNIKKFTCPNCEYATNRKDNLKTHIKRNHMPP